MKAICYYVTTPTSTVCTRSLSYLFCTMFVMKLSQRFFFPFFILSKSRIKGEGSKLKNEIHRHFAYCWMFRHFVLFRGATRKATQRVSSFHSRRRLPRPSLPPTTTSTTNRNSRLQHPYFSSSFAYAPFYHFSPF